MLANELAHLIDEEQQTEVAVVLGIDVLLHFGGKGLYRHIDIVVDNLGTNDIRCQCWVNFLSHLQSQVKATGCKTRNITFPIIALALDILFELSKLAVIVQSLLQILSQSEIEGIVTTLGIELVPEDGGEGLCLVGVRIMDIADIEHHHLNLCL